MQISRITTIECHIPILNTPSALQRYIVVILTTSNVKISHLTVMKGFRNGVVYGVKIRAPHALVMTFLFRDGSFVDHAGVVVYHHDGVFVLVVFVVFFVVVVVVIVYFLYIVNSSAQR